MTRILLINISVRFLLIEIPTLYYMAFSSRLHRPFSPKLSSLEKPDDYLFVVGAVSSKYASTSCTYPSQLMPYPQAFGNLHLRLVSCSFLAVGFFR